MPVATAADGSPLTLGDVADVKVDHQPLVGDAVINGGEGLMLIVEKLPWANTVDVTKGVEDAIKELQPGLPGVAVDTTIFRPASFVEMAIDNLTDSLVLGSLLVVFVLVLFLFSWRSALISLVTIPISLTASALVLYWRGTTINTMVLAGFIIALGAVVDDAIVDTENIVRRLREHRKDPDGRSTAKVIFDASIEVRGAVVYASMIEALALLPVFFLTGLTGSFFRPLAFAYALAVLISMLVALITTPALSMIFLKNASLNRRESPVAKWMQTSYMRLLRPVVRKPVAAYVTVAAIVLDGDGGRTPRRSGAAPRVQRTRLPDALGDRARRLRRGGDADHGRVGQGTPGHSRGPELRLPYRSGVPMDEVVGVNFGENWISIDPDADYDKTPRQDPRGRRQLSRTPARRPDLPQGAHQGSAQPGQQRLDRRAHLR